MATILLAGCKTESDLVELRLYPCRFDGQLPAAVHLEIQGFDTDGAPVGDRLEKDFAVPDGAFDDDYATVGYDKPDAVVSAELEVGWYLADAVSGAPDAQLTYDLDVPDAGGALDLSSADCPEDGGTGTTTGTETGSSDDGGTSGSTSDTSGGGTQTTSSGSTDTDTTTGSGTTSTKTPSGTTTSTGTTGVEGTPCTDGIDTFVCEPQPNGGGKLLECEESLWTQSDDDCPNLCGLDHPQAPTPAGCLGEGEEWACLCTGDPPVACTPTDQGCMGNVIVLCIDGSAHLAVCPNGCSQPRPDEPECAF